MSLKIIISILVGLVIFLFGLENFSSEIKKVAGEKFGAILRKASSNRFSAAFFGFFVTAIVQSSTATSLIAISLINTGIISFGQSLGIIIGSNVGSTITAQILALRLTAFAPYFIVTGFVINIMTKYKVLGKGLFYFGLVFFGLSLISIAIDPIKTDTRIVNSFAQLSNIYIAILAGFILTAISHSSAVVIGIVIVLAGAGLISLYQGIPILLGANLGTTITTLVASLRLNLYAKRAAVAHFIFNFVGVLLLLPFIGIYANFISSFGGTVEQQIANAHTIFNLITAAVFLTFINPFKKIVEKIVKGEEDEILLKPKYLEGKLSDNNKKAFSDIEKEIKYLMFIDEEMFKISKELFENYKENKYSQLDKYASLSNILNRIISTSLYSLSQRKLTEKEAKKVLYLVRISNALEQLGDIAKEFGTLPKDLVENKTYFSDSSAKGFEQIFEKFQYALKEFIKDFPEGSKLKKLKRGTERNKMESIINQLYENHIPVLKQERMYSGSLFVEAISNTENAIAKFREIVVLSEYYKKVR
jgi:phosphate:Na+ symporter